MFEETRKMMELFEEVGSRKVLIAGLDISKNKFTISAVNGIYEIKIRAKDVNLDKESLVNCIKKSMK